MILATAKTYRSTTDTLLAYVVLALWATFPFFVVVYATIKGQADITLFLVLAFIFVNALIFGVMLFLDNAGLVVSSDGLARRVFGRICMRIPWTGIQEIREQFLLKQRYGGKILIHIIPTARPDLALRLRRVIKISEQIKDFSELIDVLNGHISQHSIRVEIKSNGIWSRCAGLLATL